MVVMTELIQFRMKCVPNNHVYGALDTPSDYGIVIASNIDQSAMSLVPQPNDIWEELKELAEQLSVEVQLARGAYLELFDELVPDTLDSPREDRWYIWGRIPCPVCGAEGPVRSGPLQPIRVERRNLEVATQNRWRALNWAEKLAVGRKALRKFKADWHFKPDPTFMPPGS